MRQIVFITALIAAVGMALRQVVAAALPAGAPR